MESRFEEGHKGIGGKIQEYTVMPIEFDGLDKPERIAIPMDLFIRT